MNVKLLVVFGIVVLLLVIGTANEFYSSALRPIRGWTQPSGLTFLVSSTSTRTIGDGSKPRRGHRRGAGAVGFAR